jgi:DNA polymerase III sliding clamp (beta) subunit (PCNA family)
VFANALRDVSRVMVARPSMVAYTGALVAVVRRRVIVTASDGETTLTVTFAADDTADGKALIAPKVLSNWLATVPGDHRVTVRVDPDGDLTVADGTSSPYRFRLMSATFGDPNLSTAGLTETSADRFADAVAAVRHASDGLVQFRATGDRLEVRATDNYRLAVASVDAPGIGEQTGVVHLGVADILARYAFTRIGFTRREVVAHGPSFHLASRLVDDPFPDIDGILAAAPPVRASLPVGELTVALNRLRTLADTKPIRVAVNGTTMTLSVSNTEVGDGSETVDLAADAGRFSFGVGSRYLTDAVAAQVADHVDMAWTGPLAAIHLSSAAADLRVTCVVMPVRLPVR